MGGGEVQHPLQDGLAFPSAGGVVLPVMAHLHAGRASVPELGYLQRLESMEEGILQQLGGTALARAGWWHVLRRVAEDVGERAPLTLLVHHQELVEEPALQGIGALLAFVFQQRYLVLRASYLVFCFYQPLLPAFLQSVELGFLELTLPDEK